MENGRIILSPTATKLEALEKQIYQNLKGMRPELENQTIIIALSGGVDSVALLHVLKALEGRLKFHLHAVHINHGVRGHEADSDAQFVTKLCTTLSVPITQKKLEKIKPNAGENVLRQRRYEALFIIKKKLKAKYIFVAHHRDDLLETRLMRLLQGTGLHGLRAMTMVGQDGVIRPMLGVTRRVIEEYAKLKNVNWRNDATNDDTTKLRNWIRRNWVAVLKFEHPEFADNLFLSLQRIIESFERIDAADQGSKAGAGDASKGLSLNRSDKNNEEKIYSYLRHHARGRVTSRHVEEFKKRLKSPRRSFTFRLAGTDWDVGPDYVQPHP